MFSQTEINKFNNLAHEWWDNEGQFKTLHQINPARLEFILQHCPLQQQTVLDVGCGGGVLAESLARAGATVTAIDLAPQSIEVAKLHLYESGLSVDYQCVEISEHTKAHPASYDVITCMEMLEHVPDPNYIIAECYKLLKPGGIAFFSTLNRNLKSYALGILAAEYILKILPQGTHDYAKFIRPSEMRALLKHNGFALIDLCGIDYNPFNGNCQLSSNTSINYLLACIKPC